MRFAGATFVAAASIQSLAACECAEPSKRQAFKDAVVVFRGKVTKIDHMNPIEWHGEGDGAVKLASIPRATDDQTLVTFHVTTSWKGPVTPILKVYATARPSMCDGYKFNEDTEYVVYATNNLSPNWEELKRFSNGDLVYEVGQCPLRVRTDVAAEVGRLGPGHRPK